MNEGPVSIKSLAAALLAANVLIGQYYLVGSGTGASYPDIATAVAAAPDGAVLQVLPGSYSPFTVSQKSLTILGGPGVQIGDVLVNVRIENLLPHQHVTLQDFSMTASLNSSILTIADNQGTVVCKGLSDWNYGLRMFIDRSDDVRMHDCSFYTASSSPASWDDSNIQFADCSIDGSLLGAGITLQSCRVDFANTSIVSGAFSPGLDLTASEVILRGASSMTSFNQPVLGGNGTARIAPSVVFNSGTAVPIAAGVSASTQNMPHARANVGDPGTPSTGELSGPPASYGWLFAGLTGPANPMLPIAGLDPVLLLPGSEALMAEGTLGGSLTGSYLSPTLAILRGTRVTWQGVSYDAATGLQISNAITYAHH